MKLIFHNEFYHQETMSIGELVEHLKTFDPEIPIMATWESVYAPIKTENMEMDECEGIPILAIDVESYI